MTFIIQPQNFEVDGHAPLSYGVFLVDYEGEHDECWGARGFICYSWTMEGAERAVEWLEKNL